VKEVAQILLAPHHRHPHHLQRSGDFTATKSSLAPAQARGTANIGTEDCCLSTLLSTPMNAEVEAVEEVVWEGIRRRLDYWRTGRCF
jgi:hypothetical protein